MDWLNIVALVLSPLVAVLVSLWLQDRNERRKEKRLILATIWANRRNIVQIDAVRALNMIDIVFHDQARVRQIWKELYDMYHNQGLNNELGFEQRANKEKELVVEMGKNLGYGKTITALDAERVYHPTGLADYFAKSNALLDELLRVLKSSGGVQFAPKAGDN